MSMNGRAGIQHQSGTLVCTDDVAESGLMGLI